MIAGRIKWFNADKGFGFIELEDGREAYLPYLSLPFPLQKLIEEELWEGLTIQCDIEETEQGPRALNIQQTPEIEGIVWKPN